MMGFAGRRIMAVVSAVLLALLGGALLVGGAQLASLGGSYYYAISGVLLLLTAFLYLRGDKRAEHLYAFILLGTLIWAFAEVGGNAWALLPRTLAMTVVAFWLAMPYGCAPA